MKDFSNIYYIYLFIYVFLHIIQDAFRRNSFVAFRCNNWMCTKPIFCIYKTQSNVFFAWLRHIATAIIHSQDCLISHHWLLPKAADMYRNQVGHVFFSTFFIKKIIRLIIAKALSFVPRSFLQVLSLSWSNKISDCGSAFSLSPL